MRWKRCENKDGNDVSWYQHIDVKIEWSDHSETPVPGTSK